MTEIVSLLEHELRVRYPLPKTGPESPDARRTRLRKTYDEHVKRLGREYGALAATVKDERDRTGRPISHQRVRQIIGLNEK